MHPGWLMPCFDVADLTRSLEFYAGLGFRRVGGQPQQGWAVVANGPIQLGLYRGHFVGWMLNFRGDDVPALARRLADSGIPILQQSRYDPEQWPAEWHNAQGSPLPLDGCGECLVRDPDGRVLFFDTVPTERARFLRRELYAADRYDGGYTPGQPQLGALRVELSTPRLLEAGAFYAQCGLSAAAPAGDGSIELSSPRQSWRIALLPASGRAEAAFAFVGGQAAPQTLTDPDGYRVVIR
jgi:hypothetical protein